MTIRPATVDDAAAVAGIAAADWRWAFGPFLPTEIVAPRLDVATRTERLRETWGRYGPTWVAVDDSDRVVGFATEYTTPNLAGVDAEIGALYVHPEVARQGVGGTLLDELARRFVARGARSMAIHTLEQNRIGCRFYEKMGGERRPAGDWNGFPAVWFVWTDLSRWG